MLLYEFAVDPGTLTSWDRCAYILDQMGVRHGRMISEFPDRRRWVDLIRDACRAAGVRDVERKRIIEKVRSCAAKLAKSDRLYRNELQWLANVKDATDRQRKPFHAIVSTEKPQGWDRVLVWGEFGEGSPLWDVPREISVPRTAEALAECVAPIFRNCREILFVDYLFDPREPDWRAPLQALVRTATQRGRSFRRCEYHISLGKGREFNLQECCGEHLPRILPSGFELKVVRWSRPQEGERLHARYIMTEIGGVRVDKGLDVGKAGETTDVGLLDPHLLSQRWRELQHETAARKPLDECTVIGTESSRQ